MAKRAFDMIMDGVNDAIAYAQGDHTRARAHHFPDVKAIRKTTGKTQSQFAAAFHIPTATLQDWEQGRRSPDAPARALLAIIAADHVAAERLLTLELTTA